MTESTNPLVQLSAHGQSPWLDYIRRDLIHSGELLRMIEQDGLRGMTSNPAIFEKAVASSTDYADILQSPDAAAQPSKVLYERLAIRDVQDAADVMRVVYDRTNRLDGYVSLEVSPNLAYDTEGTLEEARRLWATVNRPNLMIKVPATEQGIPAFEQLISEGINVNVTLLFARDMYERIALAYLSGLEKFVAAGGDAGQIASVASFFVSRIDAKIDKQLKALAETGADVNGLLSRVAIANAKLAYQSYLRLFSGVRWDALKAKGAQPQRLLWASTGTKDPALKDTLYVETLIGPDTVNTLPPATLDAFRDHGIVADTLQDGLDEAQDVLDALERHGVSLRTVTDTLLDEGVALFETAFANLIGAIDRRQLPQASGPVAAMQVSLPPDVQASVNEVVADWTASDKVRRLWAKDASVWTDADEAKWLGWLTITGEMLAQADRLSAIAEDVRAAGFSRVLLLGMGGSSLGPEVLRMTYGIIDGYPELLVLDSTDPQQVAAFEKSVDLANTLFIVASKSGSTLEPNIFKQYFYQRVVETVGADQAGSRFIAITDPGSKMEQVARADGFRHIVYGLPSIGGRYSVLSAFGMVPAAVMGLDVRRFLSRAHDMAITCGAHTAAEENPGVQLGAILGAAAVKHGRDKVTIFASPAVHDLGAWLEQLIAESTGKIGLGLIPVDREAPAAPETYGDDRVFVYVRYTGAPDAAQDEAVGALMAAGQPVVMIELNDLMDLGAEFFRWEMATAVAGAVIGINPFDQPDVEAAKIAARKQTDAYEQTGSLPAMTPLLSEGEITLYADSGQADALRADTLAGTLANLFGQITPGDYFAISAFIEMNAEHEALLQQARHAVRDASGAATCLGFGPRFLHSTGQAYKGGPNTGVFLQVTSADRADLPVPGQKYTFGVVKEAQARGDFEVLAERGRRALRADVAAGLRMLNEAVTAALKALPA
jgi:transaldolase / glucose-6-phosphate isomerase